MPDVFVSEIISSAPVADNVYSIAIDCKEIAAGAHAGQFLHVKCGGPLLLRRPVSICSVDGDTVRFVFEVKGEGTMWLSGCRAGDVLDVLGPLGKGFDFPDGGIIVTGGGIGVPPMLFAAQSARGGVSAVLGFRSAGGIILADEFAAVCREVIVATDDGSAGVRGSVLAPLEGLLKGGGYDAVLSCGPIGMQKAVASLCARYGIPCQVSLEERMGCGVGACLVCACSTGVNGVRQMSRVCADGPVFSASEVIW